MMVSEHRITRRRAESDEQLEKTAQDAERMIGVLERLADETRAGKQLVLDSMAAGDGVHTPEFLAEIDAALDQIAVRVGELADRIAQVRALS